MEYTSFEGADRSAMREVANNSAQDAISLHDSKRSANRARGKLSVAVVATCTAILLFWMEPSYKATTFPAALFSLIVAVIWGGYSVRLFAESQQMIKNKAAEEAS
jgi:hypothetical protein